MIQVRAGGKRPEAKYAEHIRERISVPIQRPHQFNAPYPLQRRFRRWALPAAGVTLVALTLLISFGGAGLIEGIYLNLAEERARIFARALDEEAPNGWRRLISGAAPAETYAEKDGDDLKRALEEEVRELGLERLIIYNRDGVIVFSTKTREIGKSDRSEAFVRAAEERKKTVVSKETPQGGALYELYVPLDITGAPSPVVFELYEKTDRLNEILVITLMPAVAVPGLLLVLLFWALDRLVSRAQADIDGRAQLVAELRDRLERMVSASAVDAAMDSVGKGGIGSKKITTTLFYSDIRDFTGFAETRSPEDVVDFLNRVMALQVAAIDAAGGDVDKMIGDAMLARFDGEQATGRAIDAARQVLRQVARGDFPRGLGIGIYTGEVISGVVGGETRMDFTVIGDSVNISARLCSAAGAGELVVDAGTLASAGADGFNPVEGLSVKGRREPLKVRRWTV